jgi:cell division septum initiation protein DivIVA
MTQPASLDDVVSELRGLRVDVKDLSTKVQEADERSTYAANIANKAYQEAADAKRQVDTAKQDMSATQAAMIRHAETVANASTAIVKANADQTPILETIVASVATLKKNMPAFVAMATAVGTMVGALVHAYLTARGAH